MEPSDDPPLSDDEEAARSKPSVRLELSEVESHVQDQLGSITSADPAAASKGYKRRTLNIVQNFMTYLNPLGYFKNSQAEQDKGEVPFEDIRELAFIGSGGQGAVFSGKYRDREIAVKKVNDPKQTEIKHFRKLVHPNIIKFIGVCTKPPCYCVIMEYCRLGNLYEYIRKSEEDILPNQVIQWARDISNGMQFLHSKRIIHRDLKSLNVLVSDDRSLKISDFGTCRFIENQTTKMTVIGSSSWMAPELIRNESCNEKVDVWSFGVCLWELLTRQEPYKDLNHCAILYGVGSNRLSLPIPNSCPHDLQLLLGKCWQQKPKSRPSFRQILDQLSVISLGEFLRYTPSEYKLTQDTWQTEIFSKMDHFATSLQMHSSSEDEISHIIYKREDELKHAQEVREMYEKKLATASELCEHLATCRDILAEKEYELEKLAKKLKYKEQKLQKHFLDEDSHASLSDLSTSTTSPKLSTKRKRRSRMKKDTTMLATPPEVIPAGVTSISSNSLLPDTLITAHGDYSPAVKDFLDSISNSQILGIPFRKSHNRAHSYSGQSAHPDIVFRSVSDGPRHNRTASVDFIHNKPTTDESQDSDEEELTDIPPDTTDNDSSRENSELSFDEQ